MYDMALIDFINHQIPCFVINLAKRTDRKASIVSEFSGREEYQFNIVSAEEHEIGSYSLWLTICNIVRHAYGIGLDYILICEDDHQFTKDYNELVLFKAINQSVTRNADVLLGSVSWFNHVLQVQNGLFWTDCFSATQFMVIFRKFYHRILRTEFQLTDIADMKISSITKNIFIMYPFISVQKEFGYSDVTQRNSERGRVTDLFLSTQDKLMQLDKTAEFYGLFDKRYAE